MAFRLHGSLDPRTFDMLVALIDGGRVTADQIKSPLYKSEFLRFDEERKAAANG